MDDGVRPEDRARVHVQLGRSPTGMDRVESRRADGAPQVVRVYPMRRKRDGTVEFFPTLFWLTCPDLCAEVSRIEAAGGVGRMEARIARDDALRSRVFAAHEDFRGERWSVLRAEDRELLLAQPWWERIRGRGIGGIEDPKRVKCLHLHVAHHLARHNPIGELVMREMGGG